MADRFCAWDAKEVQQFKENAENSNTKKSTKTCLNVWITWAEEKGYSPDIVSYEAKELDEKLQTFFRRGEKEGWFRLRAYTLGVMIASLDRHLKEACRNISIAKNREFVI